MNKEIIEFYSNVLALNRDQCWHWLGYHNNNGYPQFYIGDGKYTGAHRWIYQLVYCIELTSKDFICHHCDNPGCINPNHLFVGDQYANMADMVAKGRGGKAKLNAEQAKEIYILQKTSTCREVAKQFNISKATVLQIWNRKTWKHVNVE